MVFLDLHLSDLDFFITFRGCNRFLLLNHHNRSIKGHRLCGFKVGVGLLELLKNVSREVAVFGCVVRQVKGIQNHKVGGFHNGHHALQLEERPNII